MTDRIELILKTQNLTSTQFADAIGIQRSSMSHILARRNKPSLDFAMKLLNRFPEISAEWLLTGKNQMFNGGAPSPALFPQETVPQNPQAPEFEWDHNIVEKVEEITDSPKNVPLEIKQDINQNSDIERIIVFFTDGTFRSYT